MCETRNEHKQLNLKHNLEKGKNKEKTSVEFEGN